MQISEMHLRNNWKQKKIRQCKMIAIQKPKENSSGSRNIIAQSQKFRKLFYFILNNAIY